MAQDRILVTGATGYIGAAVCERLLTRDYAVTGLARSEAAAEKLRSRGIGVRMGDIGHAESLAAACAEADGVVHTAMQWGPQFGAIDRQAVAAMLDALAGTERTFLYTSGTWVMGGTGGRLAGEMFPLKPAPPVAWRPAVERMVQDAVERKIRTIVLRPAMVYGHGGGALGRLASGQLPLIGDGENHWSMVHIDDLAELYVLALEKAQAGELYIAASGEPVKWKDLAAAAGNGNRMTLEQARASLGPVGDCYVLDQRIGSTKAGRQLGWIPKAPSPIQILRNGE
jgi:nucleoside-diphosphate-sugar epimerase